MLARVEKTARWSVSCLLIDCANPNADACVARIFPGEKAFPIGPGGFEEPPVLPVQCSLQPFEDFDFPSRDFDRFRLLRFGAHLPEKQGSKNYARSDGNSCMCDAIAL